MRISDWSSNVCSSDLCLPTEAEWEQAATGIAVDGNFADAGTLHPQAVEDDGSGLQQLFGDVWQWTSSAYTAYPGFRPLPGSLGEDHRPEERRDGKECVSTCRSRWSPDH